MHSASAVPSGPQSAERPRNLTGPKVVGPVPRPQTAGAVVRCVPGPVMRPPPSRASPHYRCLCHSGSLLGRRLQARLLFKSPHFVQPPSPTHRLSLPQRLPQNARRRRRPRCEPEGIRRGAPCEPPSERLVDPGRVQLGRCSRLPAAAPQVPAQLRRRKPPREAQQQAAAGGPVHPVPRTPPRHLAGGPGPPRRAPVVAQAAALSLRGAFLSRPTSKHERRPLVRHLPVSSQPSRIHSRMLALCSSETNPRPRSIASLSLAEPPPACRARRRPRGLWPRPG